MNISNGKHKSVGIIGSGIAGLSTAIRLAAMGYKVDVYDTNEGPGGKCSEIRKNGFRFDAGPSLLTLPNLINDLALLTGNPPEKYITFKKLTRTCKYFYPDETIIHAWADPDRFAKEIEENTSDSAASIQQFLNKSKVIYELTEPVFLTKSLHRLSTYTTRHAFKALFNLGKIDAFRTMAESVKSSFKDPKTIQLFNRYATYNGSSPYLAPATLNVIPHLEHNTGAFLPTGGMYDIPVALEKMGRDLGVTYHYSSRVNQIWVEDKSIKGLVVNGKSLRYDMVVSNMDVVPTYRQLLPGIRPPDLYLEQPRSSSALIFYWGINKTFSELDVHNIFFSNDYPGEFDDLFINFKVSVDPTVYVYISSKHHASDAPPGKENWFVMINAPHDHHQDWTSLVSEARKNILRKLGNILKTDVGSFIDFEEVLTPPLIESRTSSFLGALYGSSSNNRYAAFLRHPNFSSKLENLYFCGGSVHPGGGVPLCVLSGNIVADLIGSK